MEFYYATRLCAPGRVQEKEFLYLGNDCVGKQKYETDKENIRDILKVRFPNAEVMLMPWGSELCLEFFSCKEIEDYKEIYGMGFLEGKRGC